ncbi:hypothetical protein DV515_00015087 [Chloebia gouldiae]|uniref:Uncharacterized protein n=1 Tax=Chloebia gouldiae TaxID=44316 RepID=A0A3L8RWK5_CHLGU|nr:hypothetical protein DV515_00015087 [Chloebia gouldiae]
MEKGEAWLEPGFTFQGSLCYPCELPGLCSSGIEGTESQQRRQGRFQLAQQAEGDPKNDFLGFVDAASLANFEESSAVVSKAACVFGSPRVAGVALQRRQELDEFWQPQLTLQDISSEELLSVGKEKKKEKKKQQRAKGKRTSGCGWRGDDVTGLSGNTALLKS